MQAKELRERMASSVFERDTQEFSLGDTLDIKTSILLVGLTFLASQSIEFWRYPLDPSGKITQYISIFALMAGGITAVIELWPRDYGVEGDPEKYDLWVKQLGNHYAGQADAEGKIYSEVLAGRAARAKERIHENMKTNKRKADLLVMAFGCLLISFISNLATLLTRLF